MLVIQQLFILVADSVLWMNSVSGVDCVYSAEPPSFFLCVCLYFVVVCSQGRNPRGLLGLLLRETLDFSVFPYTISMDSISWLWLLAFVYFEEDDGVGCLLEDWFKAWFARWLVASTEEYFGILGA